MAGSGRGLGVAALVAGLVLTVGAYAYGRDAYGTGSMPSQSMAPTYRKGDRIFWERVDGSEVRRGDVVLFALPERYKSDGVLMQRVIGVGGDRVACCTTVGIEERVTVNGEPITWPYVYEGDADGVHRPYDVKVPRGRLFLMGDHRSDAMDSRFFAADRGGTVPLDAVQGRVTEDRTARRCWVRPCSSVGRSSSPASVWGSVFWWYGGGRRRWCRRRRGRCSRSDVGRCGPSGISRCSRCSGIGVERYGPSDISRCGRIDISRCGPSGVDRCGRCGLGRRARCQ